MTPAWSDDLVTLYAGDCLDVMRELPAASVDSVVTDPPYGLGFMGREWDALPPGREWAAECLRLLKPGGHILAFGGSRTWHRLAAAVEDAGFEIRDSIAWLYAQGFAKSLNLDNLGDSRFCQCDERGSTRESGLYGVRDGIRPSTQPRSTSRRADLLAPVQRETSVSGPRREQLRLDGAHEAGEVRPSEPGMEGRSDAEAPARELHRGAVRPLPASAPADGPRGRLHHGAPARDGAVDRPDAQPVGVREPHQPRPIGQPAGEPGPLAVERGAQDGGGWPVCVWCGKPSVVGLGTALKPAFEPVVVARKPLAGTVAANVLAYGTGALNIDATRIGTTVETWPKSRARPLNGRDMHHNYTGGGSETTTTGDIPPGRWPTNVALSHSRWCDTVCADGCPVAELDKQSGARASSGVYAGDGSRRPGHHATDFGGDSRPVTMYDDQGGASRFFPTFRYEAKAPQHERPKVDGVGHATVKPLDLMRWLVRLACPPGGLVLEPFAGSGTTAEACVIEGMRCIAIERDPAYVQLIRKRLAKPIQPDMFGGVA